MRTTGNFAPPPPLLHSLYAHDGEKNTSTSNLRGRRLFKRKNARDVCMCTFALCMFAHPPSSRRAAACTLSAPAGLSLEGGESKTSVTQVSHLLTYFPVQVFLENRVHPDVASQMVTVLVRQAAFVFGVLGARAAGVVFPKPFPTNTGEKQEWRGRARGRCVSFGNRI